jgi:hypothetical protein
MADEIQQIDKEIEQATTITSESPSYHEINIYNTIRDEIWATLGEIQNLTVENPYQIDSTKRSFYALANKLELLLLKADDIWYEIKRAVDQQAKALKLSHEFPYNGEFNQLAQRLSLYMALALGTAIPAADGNAEAQSLIAQLEPLYFRDKINILKFLIKKLVLEAGKIWGNLASAVGFTMPIQVSKAKDVFFK